MHYTIELLMQGNPNILNFYESAKTKWTEILKETGTANIEQLANRLGAEQSWFEHNCGSRWIGQEIMVVAGLCQFYKTDIGFEGHEQEVVAVYDAIQASWCSLEVKGLADQVAKSYSIKDFRK